MTERWLPVIGYEGLYEVSDHGRIKSLPRTVDNGYRIIHRRSHILKPAWVGTHRRYLQVVLCDNRIRKARKVHHLVLEAFVGPRPSGMFGCHNNDIAADNRLTNLRWATQTSNSEDMVRHGHHNQARKTKCLRGHQFTTENTCHRNGRRHCKQCERDRRYAA